jgi:MoxR-like ATPase
VALRQGTEPVVLAELMPRHWSDFVRNAPMEQVKPLGTRRDGRGGPPPYA